MDDDEQSREQELFWAPGHAGPEMEAGRLSKLSKESGTEEGTPRKSSVLGWTNTSESVLIEKEVRRKMEDGISESPPQMGAVKGGSSLNTTYAVSVDM